MKEIPRQIMFQCLMKNTQYVLNTQGKNILYWIVTIYNCLLVRKNMHVILFIKMNTGYCSATSTCFKNGYNHYSCAVIEKQCMSQ